MSSASGEEEARRRQLAPGVEPSTDGLIWMQVFGFAFFPFVLLASLDRSTWNDNAFVIACYGVFVSLLRCFYLRERTRVDLVGRRRDLNMAIWVLSALLVAMFTYRIALDMPLPVAVVLWCTTGLIIWGGFLRPLPLPDTTLGQGLGVGIVVQGRSEQNPRRIRPSVSSGDSLTSPQTRADGEERL